MKKYIITGLVAAIAATSSSFAGTASYKQSVVPVEAPCLYRDNEFQIDTFGLGGFYRAGDPVWGGGVGLNYFFARYFGLGVEQWVAGNEGIGTEWGTFGHLFLRYPFCWGLSPYAMVGIGKIYSEHQKGIGGGDVGGGLEYRFTENLGVFWDGRWFYSPELTNGGGAISRVGLRFAF